MKFDEFQSRDVYEKSFIRLLFLRESMGSTSKSLALVFVLLMALSSILSIYSVPDGLAQNVNTSPTFTISIVASINNYSSTCVFGANPDSSITYSSKYDSFASYPSSGGVYAYFRYYNPTTFKTEKLSQYIVPSNGNTTWELEVESIDQEGILTLNWSKTPVASLTLEDGITKQVYSDMNAVSNFSFRTVTGGVSDFYIIYQSPTAITPTPVPTFTPTTNPTPMSTVPELPPLTIPLLLIIMVVVAGLLIYSKKHKRC